MVSTNVLCSHLYIRVFIFKNVFIVIVNDEYHKASDEEQWLLPIRTEADF